MKEIKIKLLLFGYKIGTQCLGRGGQTTVQGQKSARQDIFKCLLNFFEKKISNISPPNLAPVGLHDTAAILLITFIISVKYLN